MMEEAEKRRKMAEQRYVEGSALGEFKHLWKNVKILEIEEKGVKVIFYGDDFVWIHGDAVIKKIEIKLAQPVMLSVFSEFLREHGLAMALWHIFALNKIAEFPRVKIEVPEIIIKWETLLEELDRLKRESTR